jgi:transcriptional regulator with XRE-family HTH domain
MPATAESTKHQRLQELSHFLRSRRARLSPRDLGLDTARPRRTPGLRREEVAVLAGVGTSWYTWLEQGRDINVSDDVVRAISRALRLTPHEDDYFRRLVGLGPTAGGPAAVDDLNLEHVRSAVERWFPQPALAIDPFWNVLAANDAVPEVLGFSKGGNVLRTFFTDPTCWARYGDPEYLARLTVTRFRADMVDRFGDPRLEQLTEYLCARSEMFDRLWNSHDVLPLHQQREKHVSHPRVGTLVFHVHIWNLAASDEVQLILHSADSKETTERLDALFHPGGTEGPPLQAAS